jgi:hypothetical protein
MQAKVPTVAIAQSQVGVQLSLSLPLGDRDDPRRDGGGGASLLGERSERLEPSRSA